MTLGRKLFSYLGVTAILLAGPVGAFAQQQQAGVAAAVRGRVEVAMVAGAVGREVKSGEPIYLGNAIKSGADSGMQILLLDQTTFTIGPNSEITIDQFVFDPNSGSGKVAASVAKGVFRFVTGKVAQTNPTDMTVRVPAGTIGIRGTIAVGSVELGPTGQPAKQEVVLLGPGGDREGNARVGGLFLTGGSGTGVTINRPGFGSQFGGTGGWGTPVRYTPEMINALQSKLDTPIQGKGPGAAAQGGQAGQQAGQQGAPPGGGVGQATQGQGPAGQGELGQLAAINSIAALGAQDQQTCQESSVTSCSNLNPPASMASTSATTFEQLRSVNSGTFLFSQNGVALSDGGSYNILMNIDFGNKTIGGGSSNVQINGTTVNGNMGVTAKSFASGSGTATFAQNGFNDLGGTLCSSSCSADLSFGPRNSGSAIAATLQHALTIVGTIANSPATVSGSGTTGPRTAGGSPVLPP